MFAVDAQTLPPHLDLPGRLLAGDVQNLLTRRRKQRQCLQE